jgi:hypothetical protein
MKLTDIMLEEQASQAALKDEMFGMLEEMKAEKQKQEELTRGGSSTGWQLTAASRKVAKGKVP